jgi:dienelactone hydrolase
MSTYNFDRRLWSLTFICLTSLFVPCDAWGDGYGNGNGNGNGNGTKTFTAPAEMVEADWSDPAEMQRTWDAALVRIPGIDTKIRKFSMHELTETSFPKQTKYPTVIYLHGCSGVWQGTYRRIDFLATNGFAVIAPLSFARKKYPQSCDTRTYRGGLYRPTLKMRLFDAGFAIRNAKRLSWVDSNNVFLMGLSQGGITTATFHSKDSAASVNARIVEGWTCNSDWEEYQGINAPKGEPVLTLVGERDPWFQRPVTKGDCGEFLNTKNGSHSVVFRTNPLGSRHELLEFKEVQQTVLKFLQDHIRN